MYKILKFGLYNQIFRNRKSSSSSHNILYSSPTPAISRNLINIDYSHLSAITSSISYDKNGFDEANVAAGLAGSMLLFCQFMFWF